MPKPSKLFAEWLSEKLSVYGTTAELVRQTGISRGVIEAYAGGASVPTLDYADKIARHFGTSIAVVLGGTDHTPDDCFAAVVAGIRSAKSERDRADKLARLLLAAQQNKP